MTVDDCDHHSWDCDYATLTSNWHRCNNGCGYTWKAGTREGDVDCTGCRSDGIDRFITKDSGKREEYASGMRRDTQANKPRFDLLLVDGVPFEAQFLTRFAALLERGAVKYGEANWTLACSDEELRRFRASALRHMMQWACAEEDEDHAAAVAFNLMAFEYVKRKLDSE